MSEWIFFLGMFSGVLAMYVVSCFSSKYIAFVIRIYLETRNEMIVNALHRGTDASDEIERYVDYRQRFIEAIKEKDKVFEKLRR